MLKHTRHYVLGVTLFAFHLHLGSGSEVVRSIAAVNVYVSVLIVVVFEGNLGAVACHVLELEEHVLFGDAVVINVQRGFRNGHGVGTLAEFVVEVAVWVKVAPAFFKQHGELVVADVARATLVEILKQLFDVFKGELQAHVLNGLGKLVERNRLGVVEVEVSEALLNIYETLANFF